MRSLFKHKKPEDIEFLSIYNQLADIDQTASKLSNLPQWHNGNGIPEKALGKDGDYFIDKDSGNIYLKENGEWI